MTGELSPILTSFNRPNSDMTTHRWSSPALAIFKQTLRQMVASRRTVFTLILSLLPVLIVLGFRMIPQRTRVVNSLVLEMTGALYLMFIVVLVALFYATSVVSDEVEGKTLVYLLTRPVSKAIILLSKFAAYWVGAAIPIVISHLVMATIMVTHPKSEIGIWPSLGLEGIYLGVILLGLLAYGTVFICLSVCFRYSALWGLLVAFGWEKITLVVPGNIRLASIIHYLQAVVPKAATEDWTSSARNARFLRRLMTESEMVSSPAAILVLLLISIFFLGLAIVVFQRREYT